MMASFPDSKAEALALVWLKAQDLSDRTPIEIFELFNMAQQEIEGEATDQEVPSL